MVTVPKLFGRRAQLPQQRGPRDDESSLGAAGLFAGGSDGTVTVSRPPTRAGRFAALTGRLGGRLPLVLGLLAVVVLAGGVAATCC